MRTATAVLFLLAATAGAAPPGTLGFGLGLSLFTPPEEGANMTAMYSARAHYWATRHIVPSVEVGYARYGVNGADFNYLPVFLRCAYHFTPNPTFDPYVGGGLVYARKWWDFKGGGVDNMYGVSALGGLNFYPTKTFGLGAGVEFVVPDITDFDSGYPAFGISLGAGDF
jgi:outer membrane protein W